MYQKDHTGFEESKEFPITLNALIAGDASQLRLDFHVRCCEPIARFCHRAGRYQILEYLGSAAFSKAVQCLDLQTGQMVGDCAVQLRFPCLHAHCFVS